MLLTLLGIEGVTAPDARVSLGPCEFRLFDAMSDFDMPIEYRKIRYEVFVNRKRVLPRSTLATTTANSANLQFQLIYSLDQQVVALVERGDPDLVLVLYALDINTGESYPAGDTSETHLEMFSRGRRLIGRFDPELKLTLSDLSSGSRRTRL